MGRWYNWFMQHFDLLQWYNYNINIFSDAQVTDAADEQMNKKLVYSSVLFLQVQVPLEARVDDLPSLLQEGLHLFTLPAMCGYLTENKNNKKRSCFLIFT